MMKNYGNNGRGRGVAAVRAPRRPAGAPATLITDEIPFDYRGYYGCGSRCRLRLFKGENGWTVAVATELRDNEGTSITNVVEQLAAFVCDEFQLNRERLFWVEHYPEEGGGAGSPEVEEGFSLVNFVIDDRKEFTKAEWHHLTVADVARMTGTSADYWRENAGGDR